MDENEFLTRLRKGDQAAQNLFWELHRDQLYEFIFARSRIKQSGNDEVHGQKIDDGEVEDILLATFEAFFRDIGKFQGKTATMKTWLYAIAKNRVIDFYRQEDRQIFGQLVGHSDGAKSDGQKFKQISLKTQAYAEESARNWQADAAPQPQIEDLQLVNHILGKLTNEQKQIIILRYLHGNSFNEIAIRMGLTEGAVKMACHRGQQNMKKILESGGAEFAEEKRL